MMSQRREYAPGPPAGRSKPRRALFSAILLLAGCLAAVAVGLGWEAAYATAFQISTGNTNWTTIYSTTSGTGGNQALSVTGTGRYIRMYGTARATQYGYSLWEFQVNASS